MSLDKEIHDAEIQEWDALCVLHDYGRTLSMLGPGRRYYAKTIAGYNEARRNFLDACRKTDLLREQK